MDMLDCLHTKDTLMIRAVSRKHKAADVSFFLQTGVQVVCGKLSRVFWRRREKRVVLGGAKRTMLAFVVWMFMPSSRPFGCRQSAASLTVQSLISLSLQRACLLLPHCKYLTLLILFRPPVATAIISLFFHVRDRDIDADILMLFRPGQCPSTHRPAKPYTPPLWTTLFESPRLR